jgi:hypothetical protein
VYKYIKKQQNDRYLLRQSQRAVALFLRQQPAAQPVLVTNVANERVQAVKPVVIA